MIDDGEFGGGTDGSVTAHKTATHEGLADESAADEGVVSRLSLVEDQPLGDRAEAFGQLAEELRAHLEGADGEARRHGA